MAHFVELDENNLVIRGVVVNNEVIKNENDIEVENIGVDFLKNLYGQETIWKQTSYNAGDGIERIRLDGFRKNFAVTGSLYREDLDAFIVPKPFPSWILNETTCAWEAPIPYPNNGKQYNWNNETNMWEETNGIGYVWDEINQFWENRIYQI
jgi:hypothetical protein